MAYIEDLTFTNAANISDNDIVYLGKLGDIDPDRRTSVSELRTKLTASSVTPFYRAGIFTVAVYGGTTQPTVVFTTRSARYERVGNIVTFFMNAQINTISGGSGSVLLGPLPFTAADATPVLVRLSSVVVPGDAVNIIGTTTAAGGVPGSGYAVVPQSQRDNLGMSNIQVSALSPGSIITASGTYITPDP